VFSAIYEAGWWWLVVIGVLATALSLAYYLNVVRALSMRSGEVRGDVVAAGGSPPRDLLLEAAVGAGLVVTIGSFFFVQPLVDLASDAAAALPF
jgi:NADH:ubiquinone oxidoreductase subunit 2 (subunit N)